MDELSNEWMDVVINKWLIRRINEQKNNSMSEYMSEWVDG